jgi:hypothetical protein
MPLLGRKRRADVFPAIVFLVTKASSELDQIGFLLVSKFQTISWTLHAASKTVLLLATMVFFL